MANDVWANVQTFDHEGYPIPTGNLRQPWFVKATDYDALKAEVERLRAQRDASQEENVRLGTEVERLKEALPPDIEWPEEYDLDPGEGATGYSVERAMNLAGLWRAGKMIGGDAYGATIALSKEIERLKKESMDHKLSLAIIESVGKTKANLLGEVERLRKAMSAISQDELGDDGGRDDGCLAVTVRLSIESVPANLIAGLEFQWTACCSRSFALTESEKAAKAPSSRPISGGSPAGRTTGSGSCTG